MFNKSFWAMKQDLAHGHGVGFSLFGGQGAAKGDAQAILNYNTALKNGVPPARAWATTMSKASIAAQEQTRQCIKSKGSLTDLANGLQTTSVKANAAAIGLKALSIAGNMLMMMGISLAISGIVKGFQALANAQENAIEKANEFISKFEEQRNTLKSNKEAIDSMSADYEKLAKGVDSLGRNVSLNSDEYARYNEIVNQIADMFPQMVQGYTDEGNAIIAHKGNVEELTKAYEEQKKAAQEAIIVGSADVFKGFKAKVDHDRNSAWEEAGITQKIATAKEAIRLLQEGEYDTGNRLSFNNDDTLYMNQVWTEIKDELFSGGIKDLSVEDVKTKLVNYIGTLNTTLNAEVAKIKPIMQAYLEQSFEFQGLDEKAQDIVKQIVGQFDSEFYAQFDNETEMASWVTENIVNKFKGKDGEKMAIEFGAMFDLQTKFNEGDITVAEYQEKLSAFLTLIGSLPDETQKAVKLLFGITTNDDGTTSSDVDTMVANVKEKFKGKFEKEIGELTLDELEILTNLDISPDGIKDWSEVETLIANAGKEANKMTVLIGDLEKASDKIKTLSSAFKELSDDGYITTKTLGEIQTATGLTGGEWAKYENKLLNAKKGSTEFNQLMSELTYKILDQTFAQKELTDITEDQIAAVLRENGVVNADAVAHQYLAVKKEKARLETEGLIFATTDEAVALLNEANASEITQRALAQLALEKMAVNQVQINTSGDIDNVIALANAAGASVMALARLRAAKANLAAVGNGTITNIGDLRRLESAETTMRQIENGTFDFEYQKLDPNDFKVGYSGVGGGKSKGGSADGSDNKPDKKDDTDAIINRINLRSKELEQQEEDIENSIEISALEKDYNKQISLTNDLIGARKTRVKELQLANVNLHNEAEKLRNNTEQWNEEEWFDSQGNATEAYIDLYNKSSKSQQELMEEQFEKISKYKKAYLDNAEEISEINKQLIQDEEDLSELYRTLYEVTISDIEHDKEMVLNKDPFADITSFYTQLQEEYHKEAERLRALDPEKYKEEIQQLQQQWWDAEQGKSDWRWENSQRWIEQRNTFNDWKLFDDSEIKAWERVVKWLREEYPNDIERIQEAEKSLFEARKKEFDKANNFANTYLDSRKTLLQSYYDVANAVAEAQHEINKELETSKTMYEWLNEDTRKLLFNQEDYNILSEELYDIQHKADKLQREYQRALASSSLETIESITSQYEMQYETLMKSYEIAKADLEIAKKKQKLNNVLNERNVRMFINGQWQWVANTEDVINAKAELADAEYAKRVEEAGLTQQQSIDNLTRRQDELTVVINKFENGIISLDEAVTLAREAIGSLPKALNSIYGNSSSKSKNSYSVNSTSGGRTFYVGADGNAPKVATIGDTIKTSDGDYKIVPAGTYGAKPNSSSGFWSIKIKEKNAKGNRYTAGGMTLMGEIKDEMLISNDGHIIPINQPTIANIGTGGIVFNHEQMEAARKIWDMTNLSIPNYSNLMNRTSNITEHTIDNRIIINGMTVDSGSADGQALINALRRYVGNH